VALASRFDGLTGSLQAPSVHQLREPVKISPRMSMEVWPQVMVSGCCRCLLCPGAPEQHHSARQTFTAMMVSFLMDLFSHRHTGSQIVARSCTHQ